MGQSGFIDEKTNHDQLRVSLEARSMKRGFYLALLLAYFIGLVTGAPQSSQSRRQRPLRRSNRPRTTCAICPDRAKIRRQQQRLREKPTYFTRPNDFSNLTFQEFAMRFTGVPKFGNGAK